MHSKDVLLGYNMLRILAPSSWMYPAIFWDYRLLLGVDVRSEVPGSFGPNWLAKMPLLLGATWEPKCLDVFVSMLSNFPRRASIGQVPTPLQGP